MSRASLAAAIAVDMPLVLDTSTVLSYLNGVERASPAATIVLDEFVATGRNIASISAVTVTETLVRPLQAGAASARTAEDFLRRFANLEIVDVGYEVAYEAARLSAATRLRTPDALVIATALVNGITVIVANGGRWAAAIATAAPMVTLCHLDAHLPIKP